VALAAMAKALHAPPPLFKLWHVTVAFTKRCCVSDGRQVRSAGRTRMRFVPAHAAGEAVRNAPAAVSAAAARARGVTLGAHAADSAARVRKQQASPAAALGRPTPHAATLLPPERPAASPQACACASRVSVRPGDAAARLAQPPARYAARKGALWGHAHCCAPGVRATAWCGAVDDHVRHLAQRPGQCAHRPYAALVARRLGGAFAGLLSGAARAAQAARCCCTVLRRIGGACRCAGVGVVCTRATRANAGADSARL